MMLYRDDYRIMGCLTDHHDIIIASTGVLFRSNSVAMKLVSIYARIVGSDYLVSTLAPIIKEIVSDSQSVEVRHIHTPLMHNALCIMNSRLICNYIVGSSKNE